MKVAIKEALPFQQIELNENNFNVIPQLMYFFFLPGFYFTNNHESQDCRGRGRAFFNSSLPLPPISQTVRH